MLNIVIGLWRKLTITKDTRLNKVIKIIPYVFHFFSNKSRPCGGS